MTSYTGKCAACGHAKSAHSKPGMACKHKPWQHCTVYVPKIDVEAHNSLDGNAGVELYEFQKQYLKGLPSKYIMAADTGTGKTFMSLAHYEQHAYLQPLLILAPASKVVTGDWERDVAQYFAGKLPPHVEVYSYEKFSRVPTTKQFRETGARGLWRDWINRHPQGFAMICDEVHKAKNPQSGIGKAVFETAQHASFFVGLSATPLPNGWIDAANYYKIFGHVKNITEFKKRYCRIETYKGFPEIVEYYHKDELQKLWNGIAKPLSKAQALDLPAVVSVPISLPTPPLYTQVIKQRLFEDKFLDNPSALLHALRQSVVEPKIKWLDEFLEGASGNIVVFYNYKSELELMLKMLKAKKFAGRQIFQINGDRHEAPPKDVWGDLDRTITLAQYQSGSTGIELTYASTIVYLSPTYSYSNYEQSIGRINRNGQTRKMTLYMLCAPASVERDIWGALRNKSDFQIKQWYDAKLETGEIKEAVY